MDWTQVAGGAGQFLSTITSGIFNSSMGHKQFKRNKWLMEHQQQLNKDLYSWQQEEYLSPSAQRRAYEAAGLNINNLYRNGASMMAAGQLGSTSLASSSAPTIDTSGLTAAGNTLAQSKKLESEVELNRQKAITEQKTQYLQEQQAALAHVTADNTVVKTALDNLNLTISTATKTDSIKQRKIQTELMAQDLITVGLEIQDLQFKVNTMNPMEYYLAQADYAATVAASILTMSNVELNQYEMEYLMEKTRTEITQQYLNDAASQNQLAQSFYNYNRGVTESWESKIRQQMAEGGYGTHVASQAEWQAKLTKRDFKWRGVMNVSKIVTDVGGLVANVATGFMGAGVKGALMKSTEALNRSIIQKNGRIGKTIGKFDSKGNLTGTQREIYSPDILW